MSLRVDEIKVGTTYRNDRYAMVKFWRKVISIKPGCVKGLFIVYYLRDGNRHTCTLNTFCKWATEETY